MAILNNNPLIGAGGNQGYNINNSVRLRSSASAYLNRTPTVAGNGQKFTISTWCKIGAIDTANKTGLQAYSGSANTDTTTLLFYINGGSNVLSIGGASWGCDTTAVFRDPSAWYHIVIAVDTTQATSANRAKIYVNGNQQTLNSPTYPSLNLVTPMNQAVIHNIGRRGSAPDRYFDGYLADFYVIDGQALEPSSFGETDTTTGVWKPKAYSGSYGTNGFYLKFSDIATTSGSNAGLGKDFSGNTNYWTTNNISVTSGTTYDAMTDSPTNTSATVANYAVMNPLNSVTQATLADGNLNVSSTTVAWKTGISTIQLPTSGKWYFETTIGSGGVGNGVEIGLVSYDQATYRTYKSTGTKNSNTGGGVAYGASYTSSDIIGAAIDVDAGTIVFYKNNSSQGTAFSDIASAVPSSGWYLAIQANNSSNHAVNFGQRPFSYTPPTGFVALNTFNLPTPTILQGNKYMDATLYTGTGSSLNVTGVNFQPDFVWIKERVGAADHGLYDAVRGVQKQLESNTTSAETTETTGLTAFNSNGFTVGALAQLNTNTDTYVGWSWKANGAGSSNTSGSITSTVSVNTTAGFSIVTYTGTGANATVGHGLGVAPAMMIIKQRNSAQSWSVYHASLGATKRVYLDLTDAVETTSTAWNNTAPTSTVYSVGTSAATNGNGNTYVAYCWAEIAGFSRFGSYTGNGSTDGPFIYTGFRPKYVMIKVTSITNVWLIIDAARSPYNVANLNLNANDATAENTASTGAWLDFTSNGFKIRNGTDGAINTSSNTYIFAAFAENPFKNSLAR